MLRRVNRDQNISNLEFHWIPLEEIGKIDEVVTAFGVSISDEFVVWEGETEDIAVDYYGCLGRGTIADYVGIEAVESFFNSLGLAFVDGALKLLLVAASIQFLEVTCGAPECIHGTAPW